MSNRQGWQISKEPWASLAALILWSLLWVFLALARH